MSPLACRQLWAGRRSRSPTLTRGLHAGNGCPPLSTVRPPQRAKQRPSQPRPPRAARCLAGCVPPGVAAPARSPCRLHRGSPPCRDLNVTKRFPSQVGLSATAWRISHKRSEPQVSVGKVELYPRWWDQLGPPVICWSPDPRTSEGDLVGMTWSLWRALI